MSIYVTGYTEAKTNGKWHCIDFYQYHSSGKQSLIPCISGRSTVYHTLEWDCEMDRLINVVDDISDGVRKECSDERGVLYGTEDLKWYTWSVVDGSWFAKANLNLPEFCGFFPRQSVCNHLSNPDENDLDISEMLSIEGYQELDVEAKKAYQYFEYTEPYGNRSILRYFKHNVMERVRAYNSNLSWKEPEISINDVRVLVLTD